MLFSWSLTSVLIFVVIIGIGFAKLSVVKVTVVGGSSTVFYPKYLGRYALVNNVAPEQMQ